MKQTFLKFLAVGICALCVSYTKAATMAEWVNGNRQPLLTGVSSTGTSANFSYNVTANATLAFTIQLSSGYTASSVSDTFSFTISGAQGVNNSVVINGVTYQKNGTYTIGPTSLANISSGGSANFSIAISGYNLSGGGVAINDVKFDGTITPTNPVPEPVNYALAGLGLIFVGGTAGRHFLLRRRNS